MISAQTKPVFRRAPAMKEWRTEGVKVRGRGVRGEEVIYMLDW
jgi:hypothetical protein